MFVISKKVFPQGIQMSNISVSSIQLFISYDQCKSLLLFILNTCYFFRKYVKVNIKNFGVHLYLQSTLHKVYNLALFKTEGIKYIMFILFQIYNQGTDPYI